jgi:hypothetical protein
MASQYSLKALLDSKVVKYFHLGRTSFFIDVNVYFQCLNWLEQEFLGLMQFWQF